MLGQKSKEWWNQKHKGTFTYRYFTNTPPLWTDLVKILTSKPGHSSSFLLECTDFKNVIFGKIPLPLFEVAEVAEVKQPRNPK